MIGASLLLAILVIGGVGNVIQSLSNPEKPTVATAQPSKTVISKPAAAPTGPDAYSVQMMAERSLRRS